jgi:hypothetical protein
MELCAGGGGIQSSRLWVRLAEQVEGGGTSHRRAVGGEAGGRRWNGAAFQLVTTDKWSRIEMKTRFNGLTKIM